MQAKFLKSIVENLINKKAVPIIDLLIDKKDVNEFLIAKKLDLTINQTRNILYKLSDYGLVSFIRKKDKRKGWYIYFWTLNIFRALSLLEEKMKGELEQLETQLKNRKEKRYYSCKTCSIEVGEETALLNDFACPECEEVYLLSDNKDNIVELEKQILGLKKEIESVSFEKDKEGEKLEKKKVKKIKDAEEEKKNIRRINSKKRSDARKKEKKANEMIKNKAKKVIGKIKKAVKKIKKDVGKKKVKKIKSAKKR